MIQVPGKWCLLQKIIDYLGSKKGGERGVMESKVHYYSGFKFCRMLHTTQRDDIIGYISILKEYSYSFTAAP